MVPSYIKSGSDGPPKYKGKKVLETGVSHLTIKISAKLHQKSTKTTSPQTLMPPSKCKLATVQGFLFIVNLHDQLC